MINSNLTKLVVHLCGRSEMFFISMLTHLGIIRSIEAWERLAARCQTSLTKGCDKSKWCCPSLQKKVSDLKILMPFIVR